jgi:hypothetical protein
LEVFVKKKRFTEEQIACALAQEWTGQLIPEICRKRGMPGQTFYWNAEADALHIALAADNGVDFLLTWNCKHIANAKTRGMIERCLRSRGYDPPVLCTPEELMDA